MPEIRLEIPDDELAIVDGDCAANGKGAEMTFPACFESQAQYNAWREAAKVCRPRHNYCEDCTPEYQARMIEESRCKYPKTVFVGIGMGVVGNMVREDR